MVLKKKQNKSHLKTGYKSHVTCHMSHDKSKTNLIDLE